MKAIEVFYRYLFFLALPASLFFVQACNKDNDEDLESKLGTLIDYDGNRYYTVELGDQWWMINNLKTTHYADGTEIPLVESNTVWGALGLDEKALCIYNNDQNNEKFTYGALYTWAAVMNGQESSDLNPSGVQGVCPDGWHVPSDSEWKELEIFLGMSESSVDSIGLRGANQGSKLASSAARWLDGYLDGNPDFGTSGFNAQPGGGRRYDGSFGHKGDNANFWTATEYSNIRAWGRHIYSSYSSVHRYMNVKSDGFSVRCVKDD
jgi:uncharacterized protein (TIGR02145 family)